jgi:Zn-dependent peptidase ImmA (M78 family)
MVKVGYEEVTNMNIDVIVEKIGVRIERSNEVDEANLFGVWIPDENLILISPDVDSEIEPQVVAHELIHAIDPVCRYEPDNIEQEIRAELRAEYGAKLILGDAYIEDGTLESLGAELNDVLGVLDEYDNAEQLIKGII